MILIEADRVWGRKIQAPDTTVSHRSVRTTLCEFFLLRSRKAAADPLGHVPAILVCHAGSALRLSLSSWVSAQATS